MGSVTGVPCAICVSLCSHAQMGRSMTCTCPTRATRRRRSSCCWRWGESWRTSLATSCASLTETASLGEVSISQGAVLHARPLFIVLWGIDCWSQQAYPLSRLSSGFFVNELFMVSSNFFCFHDSVADAPGHQNSSCGDGGWLFQLLFLEVMCRNVSMGNWKTDLHASPLSCLKKWDKVKARRGSEVLYRISSQRVNPLKTRSVYFRREWKVPELVRR